jgi:hypothetical protein
MHAIFVQGACNLVLRCSPLALSFDLRSWEAEGSFGADMAASSGSSSDSQCSQSGAG